MKDDILSWIGLNIAYENLINEVFVKNKGWLKWIVQGQRDQSVFFKILRILGENK